MLHPQTTAELLEKLLNSNIKENITNIRKYSCCAMVTMWVLGIEPDNDLQVIETINDAINANVIGKDCLVNWYNFVKWLTGRECTVDFIKINTIKDIKERTPVRFVYKKNEHWVGVENGKIVYNPLKNSNTVNLGEPVEIRKINIKGVSKK